MLCTVNEALIPGKINRNHTENEMIQVYAVSSKKNLTFMLAIHYGNIVHLCTIVTLITTHRVHNVGFSVRIQCDACACSSLVTFADLS